MFLLLSAFILSNGCAHRYVNKPLESGSESRGYRLLEHESPKNSDKLMVILTFSGGGTRAAALSYGVLEELARTEIVVDGSKRRLLDEIDIISSVSGGSFTSAYFGLFGDQIFEDFEEKFLKRNIQGKLTRMMLSPWVWPRLWSFNYNRDDMAAEMYAKEIFEGKKFNDLIEMNNPPFLMINATDVAMGSRFEFTQTQFDLFNSDLGDFPVARAVAASSAVPGLFGTVTLLNQSTKGTDTSPEWVSRVLHDKESSLRLLNAAKEAQSYGNASKRKYIHLVDGGVSDNLGVRAPLDRILLQDIILDKSMLQISESAERVVVVAVDAYVDKNRDSSKESKLSLSKLIGASVSIPMHRYSYESLELFEETLTHRAEVIRQRRAAKAKANPQNGSIAPLEVYPVYLQFNNMPDPKDVEFFQSMPTSFKLKPEAVDRLTGLAASQLADSENYKKLLQDLNAEVQPRPTPLPPEK
jgi:NTE family protein